MHFEFRGDASDEQLRELVEQSRRRRLSIDLLTNGTSVRVDASAS